MISFVLFATLSAIFLIQNQVRKVEKFDELN